MTEPKKEGEPREDMRLFALARRKFAPDSEQTRVSDDFVWRSLATYMVDVGAVSALFELCRKNAKAQWTLAPELHARPLSEAVIGRSR